MVGVAALRAAADGRARTAFKTPRNARRRPLKNGIKSGEVATARPSPPDAEQDFKLLRERGDDKANSVNSKS
jgi:hypothetical protein